MERKKLLSWAVFILLALAWGSSFILMKSSATHLTGWQIGAIRIFSAGLIFLPFAVFHISKLPRKKIPAIILSGLLGNFFPAFLFAIAIEHRVNSSIAAILNSLTPLFVIIIGVLFFKSEIEKRKIAGVLVGFIGLVILTLSKGPVSFSDLEPTLLILLATLMYGFNVNMVGSYLKGLDPFQIATVSLSFIAIPAFFIVWQQHIFSMFSEHPDLRLSIWAAVLLGVLGTGICTALFYLLIKKAGGLFASLVTYAIPVVAMLWGLWAGEDIGLIQVGCLGIILSGVYLANK